MPADGIYAVRARLESGGPWLPAAMSIGVRPTFDGTVRQLEVHVLDWNGDLGGRSITVEMVDWLRPEKKFESPEALVGAMDRDLVETRKRLAEAAASNP